MKRGLAVIFLLVFLAGLASAELTNIQIQTAPWVEVQIAASDANVDGYSEINRFKVEANEYGEVQVNLSTEKKFYLYIYIKKFGDTLMSEKYTETFFVPGEEINLELIPQGYDKSDIPKRVQIEEVKINENLNETKQNITEEIIEEVNKTETEPNKKMVTGFSISSLESLDIKYYLIAVVVFVFFIVGIFLMRRGGKKTKEDLEEENEKKDNIKVRKMSEYLAEKKALNKEENVKKRSISEIEDRIRELQEEVQRLKSTDNEKQRKIEEAKKKLIKDQEELMRLRHEED